MLELNQPTVTRPYEAVIMMDESATDQDQKALFKKNKSIIESFSGELNHIDTWGKRKLANPIEEKSRAIYFHSTFMAAPEAIKELERTMRINDKVLRVVHTRLSDKTTLPKYVENFKERLAETLQKEKEREAKFKARKAARSK
jgi:small subunit ribosomal protein S6